ncbi:MAG: hypothetical protein WDW38_007850 [Sanguina aurantia]
MVLGNEQPSAASHQQQGTAASAGTSHSPASSSPIEYGYSGKFYLYEAPSMEAFNFGRRNCTCHILQDDFAKDPYQELCSKVWSRELPEAVQNTAEWFVLELLKLHPARTWDPAEAELFYIPILPVTSFWAQDCDGTNHTQRLGAVVDFLSTSPHFQRYGGADHFMTSLYWMDTILLRDLSPLVSFRGWRCPEKVIPIPYVMNNNIKLLPYSAGLWEGKTLDFFYSGSHAHGTPSRQHLPALKKYVSDKSVIDLHHARAFTLRADKYAASISSSRFCPVPEGDTPTSRRLYDAIAAGCIPVIQESGLRNRQWPFQEYVNYADFAVVVPDETFQDAEELISFGRFLLDDLAENKAKYIDMHRSLVEVEDQHVTQPCGPLYPPDAKKHAWLGQVVENEDAYRHFPSVSASHTHRHMLCEVPLSGASYLRRQSADSSAEVLVVLG